MFGGSCFAHSDNGAVASFGFSRRQEVRKTMPGGSEMKSTNVRTAEVKRKATKRKKTYGFSVVLKAPTLTADECEALYEAGCDDGTIVTRDRVTFIAFDRKAESLEQAIRSATANVRAAGLEVERVEMPA